MFDVGSVSQLPTTDRTKALPRMDLAAPGLTAAYPTPQAAPGLTAAYPTPQHPSAPAASSSSGMAS
eukprot:8979930-Prorocentrum_lima.AAC.1